MLSPSGPRRHYLLRKWVSTREPDHEASDLCSANHPPPPTYLCAITVLTVRISTTMDFSAWFVNLTVPLSSGSLSSKFPQPGSATAYLELDES